MRISCCRSGHLVVLGQGPFKIPPAVRLRRWGLVKTSAPLPLLYLPVQTQREIEGDPAPACFVFREPESEIEDPSSAGKAPREAPKFDLAFARLQEAGAKAAGMVGWWEVMQFEASLAAKCAQRGLNNLSRQQDAHEHFGLL